MSKASDFHPALSTLDVAKFQLMEMGFAGVTNGVTLIPAKSARAIEAHQILPEIEALLDKTADKGYIGIPAELVSLLVKCSVFFKQYPENPACAAIVVYRPSIREGESNVQPVGMIIDPWEVVEPEFAHTDGAGNVKEGESRSDDNPKKLNGSAGDV